MRQCDGQAARRSPDWATQRTLAQHLTKMTIRASNRSSLITTSDIYATDLQATAPKIALGLDEVGVTGIVRGIQLGADGSPATARFDVAAQLRSDMRGAHMSRFHEAIDHALTLVGDDGHAVGSLAVLAAVVATRASHLQDAPRAWSKISATIASPRVSPATSRRTIDPFDTWARVDVFRANNEHTSARTLLTLGVRATGMTACPCAQNMVRASAEAELTARGIARDTIELLLNTLPIATHNQRSTGELELVIPSDGAVTEPVEPEMLANIIRSSMSAQTHELLKRSDELAVVEHAHANAMFVEDCVRALLAQVATDPHIASCDLPPDTVIRVSQTNHESIHAHDVIASRSIALCELRSELNITPLPA